MLSRYFSKPGCLLLVLPLVLALMPAQAESSRHLNYGYFDIPIGSPEGTEVTGRINPVSNRNVAGTGVTPSVDFKITGGTGMGLFTVESCQDLFGHNYGRISAAKTLPEKKTSYSLRVEYHAAGKLIETVDLQIHSVKSTYWESFSKFVYKACISESRMWGRVDVTDNDASEMIAYINGHDGELPGMDYSDPDEGWVNVCNTIGGLSRNLVLKGRYGPGGQDLDRQHLRKALYKAYIHLHATMPVDNFSEYQEIDYSNRSHQWRYTDPLAGSAIFAWQDWQEDMRSDDRDLNRLANEAYDKLLHILGISWQAPSNNRQIPDDKVRFAGYWSDANRDHRMRTWMALVALIRDYNRPITYESHWYPYTEGEHAGFELLPGWNPCGSFFDLQYWVQSNIRPSYFYWTTDRSSGFHPDGSISHHTGHGNDMAMFAYGYEWLADKAIRLAGWFTGTPWEIKEPFWTETAHYLTYTIPGIVFHDGYDMALSGRSHNSPQLEVFGTRNLAKDLDVFLKGIPESVHPEVDYDMPGLVDSLESVTYQRSINMPFWNGDAMIHRRGGIDEPPYYMSVKMLSTRTRGAEGFGPDRYSYHMGDGMFQVKSRGNEYLGAQFDWDWHVLPGTTCEWRTDTLPMAKSTYDYPTGKNDFAGVVSNGKCGAASFIFDRSGDPYSSAVAKKSYFFFDDVAILVGSGIQRVHPGQGKQIVTTIDQANWVTDITCGTGNGAPDVIQLNNSRRIVIRATEPVWFHQGQVGYIIWPNPKSATSTLILSTNSEISDTDTGRSGKKSIFHLAIDHGTDPDPLREQYVYAVIPNVTSGQMPKISGLMLDRLQIVIDADSCHAVSDTGSKLAQAVFFRPSVIAMADGLSIAVDRPAMVLVKENEEDMEFAVSDPEHRPDASTINLTVSVNLLTGSYPYYTAGVFRHKAEEVHAEKADSGTQLRFEMPDKSDSNFYQNRHEVYYGMPATVVIPVASDY